MALASSGSRTLLREVIRATQTVAGGLVAARVGKMPDKGFSRQLPKIVGGLTGLVADVRYNLPHLGGEFGCGESSRLEGEGNNSFHHRPHSGLVDIHAADTGCAHLRGKSPGLHRPGVDKRNIHAIQNRHEPVQHILQGFRNNYDANNIFLVTISLPQHVEIIVQIKAAIVPRAIAS